MRLGYVTVSNRVMRDGRPVGYLYREKPDNADDSGWRIFSGDETQTYADDAENFSLYNASTLVELDPSLLDVLGAAYPIAFERDPTTGTFIRSRSTS
jgi:hypothetical protein